MPQPFVVDVELTDVMKALRGLRERDAPFLIAYTLTKVGQDIKAAEYASMQSSFDRPTKYTLNSLQLTPATKTDLKAEVGYKYFGGTPADRYLGPQVDGGGRSHKSHEKALISAGLMQSSEYAVPGAGALLDAHGNVRGATFTRILSQLQASRDATQNMTKRSRKGAVRRAGGQFFVMRGKGVADGVYQRTVSGGLLPILMFVRAPKYEIKLPFYETARSVFNDRLLPRAREAWDKYVRPKLKNAA